MYRIPVQNGTGDIMLRLKALWMMRHGKNANQFARIGLTTERPIA
jgi:hypothetical protein